MSLDSPFPIVIDRLIKFLQYVSEVCAPNVIRNYVSSFNFVARRFQVAPLPLRHPAVDALHSFAIQRAGTLDRDTREAVPVPFEIVRAMEEAVVNFLGDANKNCLVLDLWQALVILWGSMRFDDSLHVAPSTVQFNTGGLQLRAWQTKRDRVRRGTRIAVCNASVGDVEWLSPGFRLWKELAPDDYLRGDFFLCQNDTKTMSWSVPVTYHAFVSNLRLIMTEAVVASNFDPECRDLLLEQVRLVTAHSLRCTIVPELNHLKASPAAIKLQGRWKDESMINKYTRNRDRLTTEAIKELTANIKSGWRADDAEAGEELSEEEDIDEDALVEEPEPQQSILGHEALSQLPQAAARDARDGDKKVLYYASISSLEGFRSRGVVCHMAREGEDRLVCNRISLAACALLGESCPDFGRQCENCAKYL